jgi:polysaccharide export outer membrane protein
MCTILWSLLVLLAQPPSPGQRSAPDPTEYVVGVEDVLTIVAHDQVDLTRRDGIPVEADGTIDFPHLGRVKVSGLTTRQIQEELKRRLIEGKFYTTVSLSVTVRDYRSQTVTVNGEVREPGTVQLKANATLAEAISQAGHFTARAGAHVIIVRARAAKAAANGADPSPEDQVVVLRSDFDTGRAARLRLYDGDTVFVPQADVFYVSGYVKNPNEFIYKPGLTVLQAITIAGGYAERAAKNRITIERVVDGRMVTIKVKESDLVQPRDTIKVPARRI